MIFEIFNNVSVIYHSFALGRGFRSLMFYATLYIVSVIYHTFALGRGWGGGGGYRRLMCFDTFNNVSVIYHSFAVGNGDQEAHVLCHLH
jgi:hypothetical protein